MMNEIMMNEIMMNEKEQKEVATKGSCEVAKRRSCEGETKLTRLEMCLLFL